MHKYFTRIPLCFLICFAAFIPRLGAQTESDGEEILNVSLDIYCWAASNAISMPNLQTGVVTRIAVNAGGDPVLWYKSDGVWKSVRVAAGTKSGRINYTGASPLVFYSRTGAGAADSDFKEAGRLQIPKESKDLLVLMFRNGSGARFYPVNISPDKLPEGKIAVMNMTSQNMALSLSGDAKVLKGGGYTIFTPHRKSENSMHVMIAHFSKKKWSPVYENSMPLPSGERCLILIYDIYNKSKKFNIEVLSF